MGLPPKIVPIEGPPPPKPRKPPGRRRRWMFGAGLAVPVGILALWVAVNRVEWLGPLVADGLRAILGVDAVTWLEEVGYKLQDEFNLVVRKGESPKAYWEIPSASPAPSAARAPAPATAGTAPRPERGGSTALPPEPSPGPPLAAFKPLDPGPVHQSWSAPGDGIWVPSVDPDKPERSPHLFKTLLHPDKNRSWAELFVVAIDLRRVEVHLMAGSREPKATEDEAAELERPAHIPEAAHAEVLAAFNGGFKTEHGAYGMRLGDITLVKAKQHVCAVARFKSSGRVTVANWETIQDRESDMLWWRQTPNCMYENHQVHDRLKGRSARKWGATLDGETVIRRSAIGIDESGDVLFVGISNHTTARAIADGMHHAGAVNVAQLDVNFSYPKFVTFQLNADRSKRIAIPLASGFEFSEDEYIRKKASRDFFYVLPKPGL